MEGTPAELNSLLHQGRIDLCLSSSIEYARHSELYLLLPRFCIASAGPVPSIRLFSRLPLDRLDGAKVILTAESETTWVLCRIILERFLGFHNRFTTRKTDLEDALGEAEAVLLIGDRALAAQNHAEGIHSYDLSTIWQEHTGFPFVFALWTLRAEKVLTHRETLVELWSALCKAHQAINQPDDQLIRAVLAEKTFFTRDQLLHYWGLICYELSEAHLQGLRLFYRLAQELNFLAQSPEIKFYDPEKNF